MEAEVPKPTSSPEKKAPSGYWRLWWRWLHRLVLGVAFVVLLLVAVFFIGGPYLVRRAVQASLVSMGLASASVQVRHVSFWGLDASDLQVVDGRLGSAHLTVNYSIWDLLAGRVDRIDIVGLQWQVRYRGGELDLGLPPLKTNPDAEPMTQLPFNSIHLRASSIVFEVDGVAMRVPLEGVIAHQRDTVASLSLRVEPWNVPIYLNGEADLSSGDARVHLGLIEPADRVGLRPYWSNLLHGCEFAFQATLSVHAGKLTGQWQGRATILDLPMMELPGLGRIDKALGVHLALTGRLTPTGGLVCQLDSMLGHLQLDSSLGKLRLSGLQSRWRLSTRDYACWRWQVAGRMRSMAWQCLGLSCGVGAFRYRYAGQWQSGAMRHQMSIQTADGRLVGYGQHLQLDRLAFSGRVTYDHNRWQQWRVRGRLDDLVGRLGGRSLAVPALRISGDDGEPMQLEAAMPMLRWGRLVQRDIRLKAIGDRRHGRQQWQLLVPGDERFSGLLLLEHRPRSATGRQIEARVQLSGLLDGRWLGPTDEPMYQFVGTVPVFAVMSLGYSTEDGVDALQVGLNRLKLGPAEVRLPESSVALRGVELDGGAMAGWSHGRLTCGLRDGIVLSIGSVQSLNDSGLWQLSGASSDAPLVQLKLVQGQLAYMPATGKISGRVGNVSAKLSRCNLSLGEHRVEGLSGHFQLDGVVDHHAVRVQLKPSSALQWRAIALQGEMPVSVGPFSLLFNGRQSHEPAELDWRWSDGRFRLLGGVRSGKPFVCKSADYAGQLASLGLWLSYEGVGDGVKDNWRGELTVSGGGLEAGELDVEIGDIAMTFPFARHGAGEKPGRWQVGYLRRGWREFKPIVGQCSWFDRNLQLTGSWSLLDRIKIAVAGELTLKQWLPRGVLKIHIPMFIWPDDRQVAELIPELGDIKISGQTAVDGAIKLIGNRIQPDIRVQLKDLSMSSQAFVGGLEKVNGTVQFNRLSPVNTPGRQRLTIAKASLGKFAVTNGVLDFRVEGKNRVLVERTRWQWPDGGWFSVHAFRFDPAHPVIDIELFVEQMDLLKMLDTLTDGKVVGEGAVYGRLAARYENQHVTIGEGFLYAKPGGGRVGLKYKPWLELGRAYLQQALQSNEFGNQIADRIIEAIHDFEYSWLTVDFVPRHGKMICRIETRGRGRTGSKQEVGSLVFNVNNVEHLLNRALWIGKTRQRLMDKKIDDAFEFE